MPEVTASRFSDACLACGHATAMLQVLCGCCLDRLPPDVYDDLREAFVGVDWTAYNDRCHVLAKELGPCPRCRVCGQEERLDIRKRPADVFDPHPIIQTHSRRPTRAVCRGSGQPPLEPGAKTMIDQVEELDL